MEERRPLSESEARSDAELAESVAGAIARPKQAAADSFVLHAPLELLARTALLARVEPASRDAARRRIGRLSRAYADAGPEVEAPREPWRGSSAAALERLQRALDAGEVDDADAAGAGLAGLLTAEELARALADAVVPRLGAAAHGSIFLYNLPRVLPRSAAAARMLRGLARELAREHEWRLGWYERATASAVPRDPARELLERLRRPPSPGDPGSNFIIPTMSLVERSGLAAELLAGPARGLGVADARRVLSRIAAWSMLQDDPAHAPYGWTHCLSMPQAVLGVAAGCSDPGVAVAVAATYVLGFRATLAAVAVDPRWCPERPSRADPLALLDATPPEAAAAVWYAPPELVAEIARRVATHAALHEDAHLAKYTLACFDAAAADRDAGRLYLAAAAYLSAWWKARADGATFTG